MLKEFLWKAFEKTGNLDTYVFYKELTDKAKYEKSVENIKEDKIAASH